MIPLSTRSHRVVHSHMAEPKIDLHLIKPCIHNMIFLIKSFDMVTNNGFICQVMIARKLTLF